MLPYASLAPEAATLAQSPRWHPDQRRWLELSWHPSTHIPDAPMANCHQVMVIMQFYHRCGCIPDPFPVLLFTPYLFIA